MQSKMPDTVDDSAHGPNNSKPAGGWLAGKGLDLQEDSKPAFEPRQLVLVSSPECFPNLDARFKFLAMPDNCGVDLNKRQNIAIGLGSWWFAAWHIATTIATPAGTQFQSSAM